MAAERNRSANLHSAVSDKNNLATIEEDYNAAQAEAEKDIVEKEKKKVIDQVDEEEQLKGCERILEGKCSLV